MKGFKTILIVTIIFVSFFIQHGRCFAKIPEPSNIFYGMAIVNDELLTAESKATISLKLKPYSDPIASYIMGSNFNAGDYYILRVPIYAHASDDPDIAHPGDEANIYINGELAGIVNIGERGTIQVYHLNTTEEDSDDDGLPDSLELTLGTNPNNPDTDSDELSDGDEVNTHTTDPLNMDTDGDGLPDGWEVAHGLNPLEEDAGTYVEFSLPSGWSMFSLPIESYNSKLSEQFPEAKVVYGYEKGTGYVRVKGSEGLQPGKGYWILFDQNQTYFLDGQSIQSYTLPVYEDGWAMIGGCTSDARPTTDYCSIGVIYKYVKGLGYQRVKASENLKPGNGYWILLNNVISPAELTVEVIDSGY